MGFARRAKSHEEFRTEIKEALLEFARTKPREGSKELDDFASRLFYQIGNYMEFCYDKVFHTEPPAAYERLILDSICGDSTLFIRQDEVEAAWTLIDGVLHGWKNEETPHIHLYRAGTWGPYAADEFIAQDLKKTGSV